MRYQITYLADGKRASLIVHAASAAAAVSATSARFGTGATAFELLSVRIAANTSAGARGIRTGDHAV
jgi:hypothetical protein